MEQLLSFLNDYSVFVSIGLIAIVIILIFIVIICLASLNKVEKKYRRLMRGVNNKNLEELLMNYLDKVEAVQEASARVEEICNNTLKTTDSCIQKMSIIRYKAFEDIGSDLSYSIALLDRNNNGVILTSIYGRDESTTYAKPIDKGISRYDLSEEEEKVLYEAMNK